MRLFFLIFLALASCDSPSLSVQVVTPVRIAAGGHVFSVRVQGDYAEAIRINPVWPPPKAAEVTPAAIEAMEAASGCAVKSSKFEGDAAIQKARLDCG